MFKNTPRQPSVMGINSLWAVLDPVKKSQSLLTVAADHRLNAQSEGIEGRNKTLILGVDMATCVAQSNAGVLAAGANHQWAGAGLYVFFKMLTEFIKAPVSLIFVLDGAARPPFKRGHHVQDRPIWMMDLAIELVEIFGYQIHRAPGEAEAELAELNRKGYIHGVISSDSDAVLYGTHCSFEGNIPKSERDYPDEYIIYTENAIALSPGSLILFALLTGGDYGDGVKGCGPTTALALVRCGYGDRLLSAFRRLDGDAFEQFLIQWRSAVRRELAVNSHHFLSRSQPKLAEDISDAFPDHRILDLYTNPITSWSPGYNPPTDLSQRQFIQPFIPEITRFCIQHFHWQTEDVIKEKFRLYIWEGIFLQILYSPSVEYISEHNRLQLRDSETHTEVLHTSYHVRRGQFLRAYGNAKRPRLVVSTDDFIDAMGLDFFRNPGVDTVTVWPSPSLSSQIFHEEHQDGQAHSGETSTAATSLYSSTNSSEEFNWIQTGEQSWFLDLTSD
ncbi:PIN domain-like protein [Pholiota molesta]|nr:PIN domain-like protein [Pholiota molesta]